MQVYVGGKPVSLIDNVKFDVQEEEKVKTFIADLNFTFDIENVDKGAMYSLFGTKRVRWKANSTFRYNKIRKSRKRKQMVRAMNYMIRLGYVLNIKEELK